MSAKLPPSERRENGHTAVYLKPAELNRLIREAQKEGVSMSSYIRRALLGYWGED